MGLHALSQTLLLVSAGAILSALFALFAERRSRRSAANLSETADAPTLSLLIRGDRIVGRTFSGGPRHAARDLPDLLEDLGTRFPTLERALDQVRDRGRVDVVTEDATARAEVERIGDCTRLRLFEAASPETLAPPDGHVLSAMVRELTDLRALAQALPVAVWKTGRNGAITWANAAYLDLAVRFGRDTGTSWPPPVLFGELSAQDDTMGGRRLALEPGSGPPAWFRCDSVTDGDDIVNVAYPEDTAVRAEQSLQRFVRTLTDTFAHLTVGLAIFDARRSLTVFNPALTDLTGLPVDYLISRPALDDVLDRMRENRVTPEPRDYRSWQRQLSALERAAADGSYAETWPLADGRTFRVTGRPHHDGGLAFLFEDITSEITLTRSFRAELELGQAVLDRMTEAVAVFSEAGILVNANRAYADLWGGDPLTGPATTLTFLEATRTWHGACVPTPVWGDARDFAAGFGDRSEWQAEVRHRDGRWLSCRFEPLPGGATLVGFAVIAKPATVRGASAGTALTA